MKNVAFSVVGILVSVLLALAPTSAMAEKPIVIGCPLATSFLYGWDAERAITLGAHEYLTKPLDVDDLEAKVNGILSPQEPIREERTADLSDDLSPSE